MMRVYFEFAGTTSYKSQLALLCPVVALSVQQRQPHDEWYTGANMNAGPQAASAMAAS